MGSGHDRPIHAFFFPFMAPSHTIPMVDMAKLFALRGCRSTIVSTPSCEPVFFRSIGRARSAGLNIEVAVIRLPLEEVGLSQEHDSVKSLMSPPEVRDKFLKAVRLLEGGKLLEEQRPDCLVSDVFLAWTNKVAARFGVPRLAFHGIGYFPLGASECIWRYKPGEITLTRSKLPDFLLKESPLTKLYKESEDSEIGSYGIIINRFYELESAYADHYRGFLGRRAWSIGPISLCNKEIEDEACRGNESLADRDSCLLWLDLKEPGSVMYICFGSLADFGPGSFTRLPWV
ncbi:hypothetical protein MLD38_023321 [Melastoma candidum]|uniref:Uncharacterized protein n=1 Tax=Melastoma candidum TaxID=119954 RepID=A0ACB9QM47_9MYRT|nr:hypothetical protein MLD38_023321 [Melastoma candidum]